MHGPLFMCILQAMQHEDEFFTVWCDATRLAVFGPLQKVCAVLRVLAYRLPTDVVDKGRLRLGTVSSVSTVQLSPALANVTSVSLTTTM